MIGILCISLHEDFQSRLELDCSNINNFFLKDIEEPFESTQVCSYVQIEIKIFNGTYDAV